MLRHPLLSLFAALRIIVPFERLSFDKEDCDEEGNATAGDHEVVNVADTMGYSQSTFEVLVVNVRNRGLTICLQGC